MSTARHSLRQPSRHPPLGTLASYTDAEGYTSRIDTLPAKQRWTPGIYTRMGRMYIINPAGRTIESGYWMNAPEDDWNISDSEWLVMPWKERAALEVKQQATAYDPLSKQFLERLVSRIACGVADAIDGMFEDPRDPCLIAALEVILDNLKSPIPS